MKRLVWISGTAAALLLVLLLTGWADADGRARNALRQGNAQYAVAQYEAALAHYEAGLETSPDSGALRFNAAQAAYMLGDYAKAAELYENAGDSVDKYLNAGNIFYWAGGAAEDANAQAQCYAQALAIYHAGITLYPQNIPLKYNYETVQALLEELMEEMEQESEGEGEDGDDASETGEQGEGQGEGDQSQDSQGEESEGAENAEGEQDDGSERDQSAEQEEQSGDAQDEGQEDGQEAYAQEEGPEGPDQEAIERILAMLESQEAESLKNNQGVVGGKDETNGW